MLLKLTFGAEAVIGVLSMCSIGIHVPTFDLLLHIWHIVARLAQLGNQVIDSILLLTHRLVKHCRAVLVHVVLLPVRGSSLRPLVVLGVESRGADYPDALVALEVEPAERDTAA